MAERETLTIADIVIPAYVFGSPDIDQEHELTGSNLVGSAFNLASVTMSEEETLGGTSVVAGSPEISTTTFTLSVTLDGNDIAVGAPISAEELRQLPRDAVTLTLRGRSMALAMPALPDPDEHYVWPDHVRW